ncbi:MAG TPA: S9 family peptidase, partial [Algoriphagus sp.]|nr:S9 family peptidase [Algoriphagus sp.]
MRDPQWMGTFPSRARWSDDSQIIYFQYNPEKNPADSTYKIQVSSPKQIQKVNWKEESAMRRDQANWNTDYSQRVYLSASDQISLENMKTGQKKVLLNWHSRVS